MLAFVRFAIKALGLVSALVVLATSPAAAQRLDPDMVRAWADDYFESALDATRAVGAAIVVVDAEGTVYLQGYGYGDLESREPIHSVVSYVPIGDIGNIFTIKSLLKLQDNAQISFDAPVNDFLTRVHLEPALANLTMAELLRHRSGLSTSPAGSMQGSGATAWTPKDFSRHLSESFDPTAIDQRRYSAYGAGLAAFVAEDISGTSTEAMLRIALEDELALTPFYNLPGKVPPKYVTRHYTISRNGEKTRQRFHTSSSSFVAAKGIHLTLSDIANLAQSILSEAKAEYEQNPEGLPATSLTSLAFERRAYPGHSAETSAPLAISGQVQSATTDLLLMPDFDAAIFVMVTGRVKSPDLTLSSFLPLPKGPDGVASPISAEDVTKDFVVKFAGTKDTSRPTMTAADLSRFQGLYAGTAWPLRRTEDLFSLQQQITQVKLSPNGGLLINDQGPFLSVEDNWFEDRQSGAMVRFHIEDNGRVTGVARGEGLIVRLDNPKSIIAGTGFFLLCFLLSLLLFAAPSWTGRSRWENVAKWVGAGAALLVTATFGLPVWHYFNTWPSPFIVHPLFALWKGLIWASAALAVATIMLALVSWGGRYWAMDGHGFMRRRRYTMGAAGLAGLIYLALQIGLLPSY